jgi:WhiB family redox-sensing transcriptional regulator
MKNVAPAAPPRPGGTAEVSRPIWDEEVAWQDRALCRHGDPNLFFAPPQAETKDERLAREAQAKAVCGTCPVREACLRFALTTREPYGVWGGMSEGERRRLLEREREAG